LFEAESSIDIFRLSAAGLPLARLRVPLIRLAFHDSPHRSLQTQAEVTPARVEEMMMNTRMQLLKIPEVLNIKCGKRVDPELPWPFFIAIDFESMDKFAIFRRTRFS